MGQPGGDKDNRVGTAGKALIEAALQVAKLPRQRIVGYDAVTDLVRYECDLACTVLKRRNQSL